MTDSAHPTAGALFATHGGPVFRYLLRMTGDRARAEELTQDTFVRVVRGRGEYEARGRERAWVFGIARNLLLNHRRTLARRPAPEALGDDPAALAGHPSNAIAIADALARLPEVDREVFVLREVGGLDYAEIERLTSLAKGAVRNRIYRARLQLREILRPVPVTERRTTSSPGGNQ